MTDTEGRPPLPAGCDRPLPRAVQFVVVPAAVVALVLAGVLVAARVVPDATVRWGLAGAWAALAAWHVVRVAPGRGLSPRGVAAGIVLALAAGAVVLAGVAPG